MTSAILSQSLALSETSAKPPGPINMEFKVRKESQSVLERTFASYEKQGTVRSYQVLSMLRTLRPDLSIDEQEFGNVLFRHDPENTGKFDLGAFNQIAVHYLIKASRQDNDDFSHKHLITDADFPEGEPAIA